VSHGESVRILTFGENVSESVLSASLPGESGHPPQVDLASEPARQGMTPVADKLDMPICGAGEAVPEIEGGIA